MATDLQIAVRKIVSVNPATGEALREFECASEAEVRAAVARARTAQPAWAALARLKYLDSAPLDKSVILSGARRFAGESLRGVEGSLPDLRSSESRWIRPPPVRCQEYKRSHDSPAHSRANGGLARDDKTFKSERSRL